METRHVDVLKDQLEGLHVTRPIGRVDSVCSEGIRIAGLSPHARLGDRVMVKRRDLEPVFGEVIRLTSRDATILPERSAAGISLGDRAALRPSLRLFPCENWKGRIIDPHGRPMDDLPLPRGSTPYFLECAPPPPVQRMALGARLDTGLVVTNTMLPIVEGQRIGLFAGSGVGKTSLLGHLAAHMDADVVVIALVGERGREIREFTRNVLGETGMARSVIVAATSDQSSLMRRRCAFSAMSVAEYFRDQGQRVLLLTDSVTRMAEAHREIATIAGEPPALRGHPPSMSQMITSLCERAGPGIDGSGYITAVFSVLVAGGDMDEPVADTIRGVLDGHILLDRTIAERGRFPAIDLVRSVSRSLPAAASDLENAQIARVRRLAASYAASETMIQAGLYKEGGDPVLDQAVRVHEDLEKLLARKESAGITASFQAIQMLLKSLDAHNHAVRK